MTFHGDTGESTVLATGAPPMPARRYIFTGPRLYDQPRRPWPTWAVSRLNALPSVIQWVAHDAGRSWVDAGDPRGNGDPRVESRVRLLEVTLAVGPRVTQDEAALFELVRELMRFDGVSRVVYSRVDAMAAAIST